MKSEMILVHHGRKKYDPKKFKPVCDEGPSSMINKPSQGGLWTSPVGSERSWADWCRGNDFCVDGLKYSFKVRFSGCLLVVDSVKDLEKFQWVPLYPGSMVLTPLFEPLLKDYDAIYLTDNGEVATRFSKARNLYGWDCETVLVLNKESITPIMEEQRNEEIKMVQA